MCIRFRSLIDACLEYCVLEFRNGELIQYINSAYINSDISALIVCVETFLKIAQERDLIQPGCVETKPLGDIFKVKKYARNLHPSMLSAGSG